MDEIFLLYEKHGANDYIGEKVSQLEHGLQAAFMAEKENYPNNVVLAAFLHDIGRKNIC
jgi:predicted HD phosphohydrolase